MSRKEESADRKKRDCEEDEDSPQDSHHLPPQDAIKEDTDNALPIFHVSPFDPKLTVDGWKVAMQPGRDIDSTTEAGNMHAATKNCEMPALSGNDSFENYYDPPHPSDIDCNDPNFDGGGKLGPGEATSASKRRAKTPPARKAKKERVKDQTKSDTAKKREFEKFKRWLKEQRGLNDQWEKEKKSRKLLVEWAGKDFKPDEIPKDGEGGEEFNQFMKRTIEQNVKLGMKDYVKTRLDYVVSEKPKTYAELFDLTVKCFVQIKGGARKTKYGKRQCAVCRDAEDKIVEHTSEECPYCHTCFKESGPLLVGECNCIKTKKEETLYSREV